MRMKEVMMMQPQIPISLASNQKKQISKIPVMMQNSKDNKLLVMKGISKENNKLLIQIICQNKFNNKLNS
jgi:hypothetical protein